MKSLIDMAICPQMDDITEWKGIHVYNLCLSCGMTLDQGHETPLKYKEHLCTA